MLGTKDEPAAPLDITKLALVVAGGVGGAVALVVAYRRQRDLEQSRFIERFGAAATQLGSPYTAVRIAGVYAMAVVADESAGDRRQQCIDVLCGYLRLPYSPDTGANHQIGRDRKDTAIADIEIADHFQYLQNDKVVRQTVVDVIVAHLRNHESSWSSYDFNFTTAHFEDAGFNGVTFSGTSRFDGAMFSADAGFNGATFSGDAGFNGVTFSGDAGFNGATFAGDTGFGRVTFSGEARFVRATFSGRAGFGGVTFSGPARFGRSTFSGPAGFNGVTFSGPASFDGVTFSGGVVFIGTKFSGPAGFGAVMFSGDARFDGVMFSGPARFNGVTFGAPDAVGTAEISFSNADFGSGAVSFEQPRRWGPPLPVFDWDSDPSTKPANVSPTPWHPNPAL
ncbi:pentapeptide repeat-containing protein [Nocardia sp. NPDC050175]|uniref:pentapeptide repeat-containing protein n=1 Tax=Nocardia sp. NPDC050175 TaxID=3364317 RepID=UPI0037A32A3E